MGRDTGDRSEEEVKTKMKPDWEEIKEAYLAGKISQRKLAESRDIPYSTLRRRAEREGWAKQRTERERKRSAKVAQKNEKILLQRARRRQERLEDIADRAVELIEKALSEARTVETRTKITRKPVLLNDGSVAEEQSETVVLQDGAISAQKLVQLSRAALNIAQLLQGSAAGAEPGGGVIVLPEVKQRG